MFIACVLHVFSVCGKSQTSIISIKFSAETRLFNWFRFGNCYCLQWFISRTISRFMCGAFERTPAKTCSISTVHTNLNAIWKEQNRAEPNRTATENKTKVSICYVAGAGSTKWNFNLGGWHWWPTIICICRCSVYKPTFVARATHWKWNIRIEKYGFKSGGLHKMGHKLLNNV